MSQQAVSSFSLTVKATAPIAKYRGVDFFGTQVAAINGSALGISERPAAAGELLALTVSGTAVVEAGGAIGIGATVSMDAQGRVVAAIAAFTTVGYALQAASAAGDFIEVLLSV